MSKARYVVGLLSAVTFTSVAAGSMVNLALPSVGRHFDLSAGVYGWLVTGYNLSFAIFGVIHGRLSTLLGARRLYLAGLGLFGVSAVISALAPSMPVMIAARVLQGIGAAAMPALSSLILSRLFPSEGRGMALGTLLGASGIASGLGPILGGALVHLGDWRIIFILPALSLAAIPLGLRWLPVALDERRPTSFDSLGAGLLCGGAAALMVSLMELGRPTLGVPVGMMVALGLGFLAAFGAWSRMTPAPLVPPAMLRVRAYRASVVVIFLNQAARIGGGVLAPIVLIQINGLSPLWTGPLLLPGAVVVAFLSPWAGHLSGRVGVRLPVTLGTLSMVLGTLLCAMAVGAPAWLMAAGLVLHGLGFALMQSPCISAIPTVLASPDVGVGMGIFMMASFLGGAFGVATAVTLSELQPLGGLVDWFSPGAGAGAGYAQGLLALLGLPLLALLFIAGLPHRAQAGLPEQPAPPSPRGQMSSRP